MLFRFFLQMELEFLAELSFLATARVPNQPNLRKKDFIVPPDQPVQDQSPARENRAPFRLFADELFSARDV